MSDQRLNFTRTLDQWCLEGGNLTEILSEYRQLQIDTRSEVAAICRALDALRSSRGAVESDAPSEIDQTTPLHVLGSYFEQIGDEEGIEAFTSEGLPMLRWWVADAVSGKKIPEADTMLLLGILAMYRQRDDAAWVVKAALSAVASMNEGWKDVFSHFGDSHPYTESVLKCFRERLPRGRCCFHLLMLSNSICGQRPTAKHAFDTVVGLRKLLQYLEVSGKYSIEYARTAASAIHYFKGESGNELLRHAQSHPDPFVAVQADLVVATQGDATRLQRLSDRCLDVKQSWLVQSCLRECGKADLIPDPAKAVDFLVQAQMAHWLCYESSYSRAPDRLEIIDRRNLFWIPIHKKCDVYLVKYHYNSHREDEPSSGIGMVGSMTYSLIGESNPSMPIEDIYGLHCCWELEQLGDPLAPRNRNAKTGRNLLRRQNDRF